MMMTHTSGLHDYFDVPTEDGTTIADGATDKAMLTRGFTPEELVTLVADSGLSTFEPGAEGLWSYSNTGYILLGLIIEEATGQTYEENLNARIIEPLGLTQTYLQTGQPERGRRNRGRCPRPTTVRPSTSPRANGTPARVGRPALWSPHLMSSPSS